MKHIRALDIRKTKNLKGLSRIELFRQLIQLSVCHCREAEDGEHECPAIEARETLFKLTGSESFL